MSNKTWKYNPETETHELYFEPYNDEVLVATLKLDEDDEWEFTNKLNDSSEYWDHYNEGFKSAREDAEAEISRYFEEQAEYYSFLKKSFEES